MTLYRKPQRPLLNSSAVIALFPVQDVHPSDCLGIVDLAEIDVSGLHKDNTQRKTKIGCALFLTVRLGARMPRTNRRRSVAAATGVAILRQANRTGAANKPIDNFK